MTFTVLTRPALLRMQGARDVLGPMTTAILSEPLANPGERRHFMRVVMNARGGACSAGNQSSHILSALAESMGLVDVPPKTTFPAGTLVQMIPWT